ncbi:hypothetical protein HDU86_004164 [Geranomyces michiganensis]|nr:hypothetical protein HDU86_004164 [Geranomyces michiganensis]
MALGFDYFVVKRCVDGGHASTLESGANWILQHTGPSADEDSSRPVLALGAARSTTRPTSPPRLPEPVALPSLAASKAAHESTPSQPVVEPQVESRLKTSRKDYVDLATTQVLERAKKLKQAQTASRSAIIQQIAEDRATMRDRTQRGGKMPLSPPSSAPSSSMTNAALPSGNSGATAGQTTIQFRLPSNRTVKVVLAANTALDELYDRVVTECQTHGEVLSGDFTLLQAFPRRVFAKHDASGTLLDAGLVPSATLNVVRSATSLPHAPMPVVPASEDPMDLDSDEENDHGSTTRDPQRMHILPMPVVNWNVRGEGHRLSDLPAAHPVPMDVDPAEQPASEGNPDDQDGDSDSEDDEDDEDDEGDRRAARNPPRNWGTAGHRLTDEPAAPAPSATSLTSQISPHVARKACRRTAPTLKQLCITTIEPLLTRARTDHLQVLSLLPPALGELLVAALRLNGRLTVQSLGRLGPIRLQSLDLSNYRNVADSWCESLTRKWWFSLETLRLGGCDLLTDQAIGALKGMTCLEDLDLSGCRITDGGIGHLAALPTLRHLSLARTKITSCGLSRLPGALPHLQSLNLADCSVGSPKLLSVLAQFSELLTLNVQRVKFQVADPQLAAAPRQLRPLQEIDLTATGITSQDLIVISTLWSGLQVLKIGDGPQITAMGLETAVGNLKALAHVHLPSKDLDLSKLLPLLFDRPLARLDLAGCTGLPSSLAGIAKLRDTLTYLDLNGSPVTDAHLPPFATLSALTYLSLERTAITDTAVTHLLPLSLQTLALASTLVTSTSVQALSAAPDMARSLVVLGLERTRVSDDCLTYLTKFVNVETLNFSYTKVTKVAAAAATKSLTKLRILRLVGCEELPEP